MITMTIPNKIVRNILGDRRSRNGKAVITGEDFKDVMRESIREVKESKWQYCDECKGKGCAGCEGKGKWLKMPR